MNLWIALFIGIALGWIIEWIIDFFYTRNKTRRLESELAVVRREKAELEGLLNPPSEIQSEEVPAVAPALEEEWQPVEAVAGEQVPGEDVRFEEIQLIEDEAVEQDAQEQSNLAIEGAVIASEGAETAAGLGAAGLAGVAMAAALISDQDEPAEEEAVTDQAAIEEPVWLPFEGEAEEVEDKVDVVALEVDPEEAVETQLPDETPVETAPEVRSDGLDSTTLKKEIEYVEGIGPAYGARLREIGILTGAILLQQGSTPKGRAQIVEKSGIRHDLVLTWVNHADLYRIKGIGSEYAELLEAAGVDTVLELASRNPNNLFDKMAALNVEKKLVRQIPSLSSVKNWIDQAKSLPRMVSY